MNPEALPFSAACERNKRPILEVLTPRLPQPARLLEIGAGTGQHAVFMAAVLPGVEWWPTDRDAELPGLRLRLEAEAPDNVRAARPLDVLADPWPDEAFDAVYSANTAHIMSWPAVQAMIAGAGRVLRPDGRFFLYGPFNIDGHFTAASNEAFDHDLRRRDPAMGLRDLAALESVAASHQMVLEERLSMPANNFLLVFLKTGDVHDSG